MSNNKTDISQIRKYLNGELDARAMHQLEREAQDDPFLMDALEGFEGTAIDQQANLSELQQRLAKSVEPKKERSIILWRVLPLAASLLIAISIGYWFLQSDKPIVKKYTGVVLLPQKTNQDTAISRAQPNAEADNKASEPKHATRTNTVVLSQHAPRLTPHQDAQVASALAGRTAGVAVTTYKEDTTEYRASAYPVHANAKAEELLKKLPGVDVDANGNVTAEGKQVTKARINGKDFFGGDVAQATKNLPADIISKIQIIDDYGDQANATGIKTGEPNKILNITTKKDTALIAQNKSFGSARSLNEVMIRGSASPQKREVTMSAASITTLPDTNMRAFAKQSVKAKKTTIDSSSNLAEVVVPGYADKQADIEAQPLHGWKAYLAYIKQMAVMPDGSIGRVKLAFRVDTNGSIYGVRIIRGKSLAMNERAIDMIKNGPAWIGERRSKEIRLKIKFHKKA